METTSRAVAQVPAAEGGQQVPSARRTVDGYLQAPFPWYGLDEAFTGPRWLMQVGTAADGAVEHGSVGHGDEPSVRHESTEDREKFAVVVTVGAGTLLEAATLFWAMVTARDDCAEAAAGEITSATGTIKRAKTVLFMVQNSPVFEALQN